MTRYNIYYNKTSLPLYSGVVSDVLDFFLPKAGERIMRAGMTRTTNQTKAVFGPEFACEMAVVHGPSELQDTLRLKMLKDMVPGCVQVIYPASEPHIEVALYGDISALLAQKHGAIGALLLGPTRDADIIASEMDFPVWHTGVCPKDAFGIVQIVSWELTGDYIFADGDGVFKIYKDSLDNFVECAKERIALESKVRYDLFTREPLKVYEENGRW